MKTGEREREKEGETEESNNQRYNDLTAAIKEIFEE
jgi:hypothetical protein